MTAQIRLDREDQELAREALAYVSRRVYDQRGSEIIGDLEDRLDRLLLSKVGPGPGDLTMPAAHLRAFRSALDAYTEALDHPSTDQSNRVRIARMRRITKRAAVQGRWPARAWNRLRAFLRRR
ncbi:MAG: hypothetical protein V1774_09710 [Candidatus Eisenbacteria bacterium]